ncbi:radical SAM protein [Heliorestis acidaminivorans]|uniref:Radical SAM protein n=1 Tax=Heliorestis acidaminivorans TaxID=553427 RepID=A0A6I0EYP8_9FIRM|nr:radical SAM/SPASM domain-containing protein [Heliorestis acidaminivorans]KAB2953626.1 radical SAM protein [Heliorestis acidaminivorans]
MSINVPINPTYKETINHSAKMWEEKKCKKYREYRKKWSHNPKNHILEEVPLHLDIEPTNACNLKCPMCARTVLLQDSNKKNSFPITTMDMDLYRKIIDEATEIGVYSIKLNWLGEPLIHPELVNMVKYAKDKGIIDVMLNTNAVLLSEKIAKDLIEAGLDKIFFSFDSPYKEKYEEIRVGADYESTLENIKRFVEIRNKMGKTSPLTRVSMVLMKDNQDEYEGYVNLFKDIVDVVAYVEYRTPVGESIVEDDKIIDFSCSQLWQRMFVSADGDVIVCCVDSEKEYVVGNLHKDSIRNIWQNNKYMHIRNMHKKGNCLKVSICSKCDLPFKKQDGDV